MQLYTARKDGSTLKANLQSAEEQTGKRLIDEPEPPLAGQHLWDWFWQLDAARGGGMSGPLPLTFPDIQAWAKLLRLDVEPWEVVALRAMDNARLDETDKING